MTGATGFVGTALTRRLVDDGHTVRVAVRSTVSRFSPAIQVVHIQSLGPDTDWSAALRGVDRVVHLAARAHVVHESSPDAMQRYRTVNALGTLRLAQAAAESGVRRFVFLSSVRVHGARSEGAPLNEASPLTASDPYGRSKAEAEQELIALGRRSSLETVVLRAPLIYGPGVKGNFARLLALIMRGVPLPLGAVRNRRSLLGLENLVDATVRCLDHPAAAGQTFLVSDGEDISTAELVRRLARALGKTPRLVPVPPALLRFAGAVLGKADDIGRLIDNLVVDSSLIRTRLGWKPPLSLDEGFAQTAAWYRQVSDHHQ